MREQNYPIRVLHISINMNRGGAEAFIMNIYRNIDRSKVQFDFLLHTEGKNDFSDEIIRLGGRIFTVANPASSSLPTPRLLSQYKKELRDFFDKHKDYKIIHAHMSGRSNYVLKIAKEKGIPSRIAHSHIALNQKNLKRILYEISGQSVKKYANHYFACSELAGYSLFGRENVEKGMVKFVNNSIDVDKFEFNSMRKAKIRRELNVENKFIIGSIARFTHQKNHRFIVDIFKEVKEIHNEAILLLVGAGPLLDQTKEYVKVSGLEESVIFAGVRSDVVDLLSAMDVFLMPSLYEGLPVTLIEAQSSGIKCIVSDTITKEVGITDLVEFIPLEKEPNYWAKTILQYKDGYARKNLSSTIKEAGYDVTENSKMLEEYYLNCFKHQE